MKYIGQCLVNYLDHINMPNFPLSSLDNNTTPKKNPQICALKKKKKFKQNDSIFYLKFYYTKFKLSRTMF